MDETSNLDLKFEHLVGVPGGALLRLSGKGGHAVVRKLQDMMERIGILVRLGRSLLGKKSSDLKNAENLLGKVVLLAGSYGRGNLFIILMGEIPKNQVSAFGELRAWMESVGGRTLQR